MTKPWFYRKIEVSKLTNVKNNTKQGDRKMCKIYGYCRISTAKQSIDRQERNIRGIYPEAIIVKEVYTGTKSDRPEWKKLMKRIQTGDTIIFDSVSRMSRDAEEGFQIYKGLFEKGVNLVFLKERHVDTATYQEAIDKRLQIEVATEDKDTDTLINSIMAAVSNYILKLAEKQIRLAFEQSEKEVADLHERTKEGIETARLAGKQIGQQKGAKLTTKKSVEAKKEIQRLSKDFDGSLKDIDVMKIVGIARNTYYKYKRQLDEERS